MTKAARDFHNGIGTISEGREHLTQGAHADFLRSLPVASNYQNCGLVAARLPCDFDSSRFHVRRSK